MTYLRKTALAGAAFSILLLGGCDVSTPSQVNVRQIQLRETAKTVTLDARRVDEAQADGIASSYLKTGKGPLSLTVSYAAGDMRRTAEARREGAAYVTALRKRGVSDIKVSYVAMDDASYADVAVASWTALAASPPKDCTRIPGYQGAETLAHAEDYGMGCETAAAMSRMIADPSDLLGKTAMPESESRRQGALVEKFKAGTPNPKLQGLNASNIGTGSGGQ